MPKSNVVRSLNELKQDELCSLLLFALSQLQDNPKFRVLSRLCFILDDSEKVTKDLKKYYVSTRLLHNSFITFPKIKDLSLVISALILYGEVNIDKIPYEEALQHIDVNQFGLDKVNTCYNELVLILNKYDFKRG